MNTKKDFKMRYYEFMTESRIQELEKYKNKGYYVSFTRFKRIGTYPNGAFQAHRSPYGIYAYPLDMMYDEIVNLRASFSNREYIFVLKANVPITMISDLSDFNKIKSDVDAYIYKNYPKFAQSIIEDTMKSMKDVEYKSYLYVRDISDAISEYSEDHKEFGGIISMDVEMTKILKLFGIKALEDDIGNVIGGNGSEKYQTVFFQKDYFDVVEMIINKIDNIKVNDTGIKIKDTIKWIKSGSNDSEVMKRLQTVLVEFGNILHDKNSNLYSIDLNSKNDIRNLKDEINNLASKFVWDFHSMNFPEIPKNDQDAFNKALKYFNSSL